MNNWIIIEERKLSITTAHRPLQEARKYDPATVLTGCSAGLLDNQYNLAITSLFDLLILSFLEAGPVFWPRAPKALTLANASTGGYAVNLLARTRSCSRFQHDDVSCGHTSVVTQGYYDPVGGLHHSVRDSADSPCFQSNLHCASASC